MKLNFFHTSILCIFTIACILSCSKDSDSGDPIDTVITVTTSNFSTNIDENSPNGQLLGTVTGATNQGSVVFSISEQNPTGSFSINSVSGELTIANESIFDFETNPTITGTVKVANGSVFKNASITINLNDLYEEKIYVGSVGLGNQQAVDNFGDFNYTEITGLLQIGSHFNSNSSIHDLSPLSSLHTVGGSLILVNNNILTNFNGLHNITAIGDNLHVEANQQISNLDEFINITNITELLISDNTDLLNLDGLDNLMIVLDGLRVTYNYSLTNLCGLENLFINGEFEGNYRVFDNIYNPTQQDIIDGNCSL